MKRLNKLILTVIILFIIVAGGIFAKLFVIGKSTDSNQLYCEASLSENTLSLNITSLDSAAALKSPTVKKGGSTLYVTVKKVLVSPLYNDGTLNTEIDVDGIDEVILGGEAVWSK